MTALIEADGLVKSFGTLKAVDGISSRCRAARCWASWAPTAPANPPPCGSSPASWSPTPGRARIAGFDVQEQAERGQAAPGLSARRRAALRRNDAQGAARFVAELRGLQGRGPRQARRQGGGADRPRPGARPDHRDPLQGLQAPGRHRPGDPARPGGADHGRAHRRARPQPEAPGARADRRDGQGEGHHRLHPHPRGGRGGLHARRRHQQGPHRRRRHRRGPDAPRALSRRRRHPRRHRQRPRRCAALVAAVAGVDKVETVGAANGQLQLRAIPKNGAGIVTDVASVIRQKALAVDEIFVERGKLDDVFRQITSSDLDDRDA